MSLKPYPAYKDSGVAWLGDVPEHWAITKTKHICKFSVGWTPPTGNTDSYKGENLWANISDLGPKLISDTAKRISNEAIQASDMTLVPKGSLLFSFKLSIGQVSFAGVDMYTNEAIAAFHSSDRLDLSYAYYAFPVFIVLNASENIYGAKLLNQELIRGAFIALPALQEQSAIATFLDRETSKIDGLIAEQERLVALLAEKRQATISHAVTKGLTPAAHLKDSGVEWLGEIPAHWAVSPLKYLVTLKSGGTPSKDNLEFWNGNVPWASAKDLKTERLADTIDHITEAAIETGGASLVRAGSVLVVVRGMILARIFPVTETLVPMAINQDLKALEPSELIHATYLSWLLRGSANESLRRLDEAGHGTKALRMETWTAMILPVPPLSEQIEIVQFIEEELSKLDELNTEATRVIELLKERRSALISAAVTGKIDVRVIASDQVAA